MNSRYDRQIILPEVGVSGQKKLMDAKVLVIGAGGLGAPVLQYLTAAGVGHIGICDSDSVSLSNLHRQILFHADHIGKNKARVASDVLHKLNHECEFDIIEERINHKNIEDHFSKYQIIVDCTDNFQTKFLIHDTCYLMKKKLVQASIYQYEGQLQCFDFSKKTRSGCLRCLWPKTPTADCVGDCQESGVLGVVPGVLGSLQCNEVLKMILKLSVLEQGKTLILNLKNLKQKTIGWKKNSECPLCDPNGHIKKPRDSINLENFEVMDIKKDFVSIDLRKNEKILPSDLIGTKSYLFICQKGIRSYNLVKTLRSEGWTNTYSLFGGVNGQ